MSFERVVGQHAIPHPHRVQFIQPRLQRGGVPDTVQRPRPVGVLIHEAVQSLIPVLVGRRESRDPASRLRRAAGLVAEVAWVEARDMQPFEERIEPLPDGRKELDEPLLVVRKVCLGIGVRALVLRHLQRDLDGCHARAERLAGYQALNEAEPAFEGDRELRAGGKRAQRAGQQRHIVRMHGHCRVDVPHRAVEAKRPGASDEDLAPVGEGDRARDLLYSRARDSSDEHGLDAQCNVNEIIRY